MQVQIQVGEKGKKQMPYSEVCMHLGVAGQKLEFQLLTNRSVQLFREDGSFLSFPILPGEAGLYQDDTGFYYHT